MSISGTYDWKIEQTRNGKFLLSAHGFLVGAFATRTAAEECIAHTVKKDKVERRARQQAETMMNQWTHEWSSEFGLPRSEVWEDIKAGVTAMLADLER
jgi:hypothetical protein